jgi:hypothetical protein
LSHQSQTIGSHINHSKENGGTMIRVSMLSTAILSAALWMSTLSASARTNAYVPAVHRAEVPTLWASAIFAGGDNGDKHWWAGDWRWWGGDKHSGEGDKHWGNGGNGYGDGGYGKGNDGDGDKDDHKGKGDHDGHDPTPEPSTILSFGSALLIGGGVLYSRRLRRKGN